MRGHLSTWTRVLSPPRSHHALTTPSPRPHHHRSYLKAPDNMNTFDHNTLNEVLSERALDRNIWPSIFVVQHYYETKVSLLISTAKSRLNMSKHRKVSNNVVHWCTSKPGAHWLDLRLNAAPVLSRCCTA